MRSMRSTGRRGDAHAHVHMYKYVVSTCSSMLRALVQEWLRLLVLTAIARYVESGEVPIVDAAVDRPPRSFHT